MDGFRAKILSGAARRQRHATFSARRSYPFPVPASSSDDYDGLLLWPSCCGGLDPRRPSIRCSTIPAAIDTDRGGWRRHGRGGSGRCLHGTDLLWLNHPRWGGRNSRQRISGENSGRYPHPKNHFAALMIFRPPLRGEVTGCSCGDL